VRSLWIVMVLASPALADDERGVTIVDPDTKLEYRVGVHEGVPWPIVPAPVEGRKTPKLPPPRDAVSPPTAAGVRVIATIDKIRATLQQSRYQHSRKVRARDGVYHWDCSGMVDWVIEQAAPRTARQLPSRRLLARDFANAIEAAPEDGDRKGWRRIARIGDVMPGDVFAWRRPRGMPSRHTGHTGIVLDRPVPVPGLANGWAIRIADASGFSHQADTRDDDPDGGFGIGTITVLVDDDGRPTHYGWSGTRTDWYVTTPVFFGRVVR
jgi:hypothetical protein